MSERSILPAVSGSEAVLVMHFLDVIFVLQYPMYKPSMADGGRGWVLFMLLRTRQLYDAALSWSAYHRETVLARSRENCNGASRAEQEIHASASLASFQTSVRALDSWVNQADQGDILSILASSVQLMFFNVSF